VLSSHVAEAFFPLSGAANTWSYSGTVNGLPATAATTVYPGPSILGIGTAKVQTIFSPDGGGDPIAVDTRFYAYGLGALKLYREDTSSPHMASRTFFGAGAAYLTPTVDDGAVIHITDSFAGTSIPLGRSWTGQFTGDMTVAGLETISTAVGTFEALKISLAANVTENGSTGWTGSGTIYETSWLVRGIGVVHVDYAATITFSDQSPQAFRFNMGLVDAGRLGGINQIILRGKGVEIPYGDTRPHTYDGSNYGGIDVDGQTKIRVFRIFNNTSHPLTLAPGNRGFVNVTGANANEFVLVHGPAQVIQPGGNDYIALRFDPAADGFRYATVSFASTDTVSAFSFNIQGNGIRLGRMTVRGPTGGVIANGDSTPDAQSGTIFGAMTVAGTARIQRIFTITNTSTTGTLQLLGTPRVEIQGADASAFTVTYTPSELSGPGVSTFFKVSFDPESAGVHTAVVSIYTNDPFNRFFTFTISGTGLGSAQV
jgi:hypothetical protein